MQQRKRNRAAWLRGVGACFLGALLFGLMACTAEQDPGVDERAVASDGYFLSLSDIHFDPFYAPALFDTLVASAYTAWPGIFESSSVTAFSQPGHDTNYPLLHTAFAHLRGANDSLDYVIITGDFLGHDFWDTFKSRYTGAAVDSAYKAFVLKTMRFLATTLEASFPGTPVFPALGNNDSFCGDYGIAPGTGFLEEVARIWEPLIGQAGAVATFSKGGYYAVPHPVVPGRQFVVLNDNFFSNKYLSHLNESFDPAACNAGEAPAQDELAWLRATLAQRRAAGDKVTLAFHIPPGLDEYATNRSLPPGGRSLASCPTDSADVVPLLKPQYDDSLRHLLGTYGGSVQAVFAGHTHKDDFRVFTFGGETLFVHITPAISPIFGNNPGFQVFRYDRATGDLLDYESHYLINLAAGPPGQWKPLYAFTGAYRQPTYDAATLDALVEALRADSAFRAATYMKFHSLDGEASVNDADWPVYACSFENRTARPFLDCYCTP